MDAKQPALQDSFLNSLCKEQIPVSIFLVNGIRLLGHIESFDLYVVLLKNTTSQLVYKHAISTVVPDRNVAKIFAQPAETGDDNRERKTGSEIPRWAASPAAKPLERAGRD